MVYHRRAVSPVISAVILLSILLTMAIAALYYVSAATMRAEASGEAAAARSALYTLAKKINSLAGVENKTYEVMVPTRYGVVNIVDSRKTLSINLGYTITYPVEILTYSIPSNMYSQEPEDIYGSSALVSEGGPVTHLYTQVSNNMWIITLDTARVSKTLLYTENLPFGTRYVYALNIVVLSRGTVAGTSAAPSVYVRLRVVDVNSLTVANITSVDVSVDGSSVTISFETPNIVIVSITTISVDIIGGGGA